MDITIRQVRPEDLDGVTYVESVCFPSEEAADKKSFEDRIRAFPENFLVAEQKGEIVGFIDGAVIGKRHIEDEMFERADMHDPKGEYQAVYGLAVLPDLRRRGIGTQLMEQFIQRAKKHGLRGLTLTCKAHKIKFYESFGYGNEGISRSVHGGAVWYDMVLDLKKN